MNLATWTAKVIGRDDGNAGFPTLVAGRSTGQNLGLEFIAPQLASFASTVPDGDGWVFERKYDGYRLQAIINGADIRLFTRRGHDWTNKFPNIVWALSQLPLSSAILDGEICAMGERGQCDFVKLCAGLYSGAQLSFFAFDLLALDGTDLTDQSLLARKALLTHLLGGRPPGDPVQMVAFVSTGGAELFETMRMEGNEGIIAKRLDAPYRAGERSPDWLKIKCTKRQEFVIAGWRPDNADGVKSLALATYENGELIYRGRVGTGFSVAERKALHVKLLEIERPLSTIQQLPNLVRKHVRWVEPILLAEIEFAEISSKGIARSPVYLSLREDKSASDASLER